MSEKVNSQKIKGDSVVNIYIVTDNDKITSVKFDTSSHYAYKLNEEGTYTKSKITKKPTEDVTNTSTISSKQLTKELMGVIDKNNTKYEFHILTKETSCNRLLDSNPQDFEEIKYQEVFKKDGLCTKSQMAIAKEFSKEITEVASKFIKERIDKNSKAIEYSGLPAHRKRN